jgi:hypothetical protein
MEMPRARLFVRNGFALLTLALVAVPAAAEIFKIQLTNGTVIESSYQPQEASWDPGMVLLLTEVGNWIGVRKADIDTVITAAPLRGFGVRINTTTVLLGSAPNDAAIPADQQPPGQGQGGDPVLQALQAVLGVQQQPAPAAPYTIQQGVQTEEAQGIPAGLISPYGAPPQ